MKVKDDERQIDFCLNHCEKPDCTNCAAYTDTAYVRKKKPVSGKISLENGIYIPDALFSEQKYKGMNIYSFLLYGFLLRELETAPAGDIDGRKYVYFPIVRITSLLGCCPMTATAALDGLENAGLIERGGRHRRSPNRIFVEKITEV